MAAQRYQDPQRWAFNDADRASYSSRYWRCPVRLVRDGLWAKLWRAGETRRGGGAVTSVLPVLAFHTWPEKTDAMDGWTGWTYLSRRRIAGLAGVHKDTVTAAFGRLVDLRLMVMEPRARGKYEGGYKTYYALATSLYPQGDEAYAEIKADLFYGGTWFMLPSPACRHLYMVLACLDPIGDEDAYLARIEEAIEGDWDQFADHLDADIEDDEARVDAIRAMLLAQRRASAPRSLRELEQYAGLRRSTVIKALQALTVPIFGQSEINGKQYPHIPLIAKGSVSPRTPTWYVPDRRAWRWYWRSDFLNAPERVEATQHRLWPGLFPRRTVSKRRPMKYPRQV
jgi:hypothetical protein